MDYDPTAQKVAEAGYSLAKAMTAEIILMHVIAGHQYYTSMDPVMGFDGYMSIDPLGINLNDGLKDTSQDFLDQAKNHLYDTSIKTLVKEGDSADSILETAKDLSVDIIVMGSHSRKWLGKLVMGSVTEKVLRKTTVPVFIIPTKKLE